MIHIPDTNILLRFADRTDAQHAVVLSAVRKLKAGGDKIYIVPQTCVEFWNVCTRPTTRNGFGFTVPRTNHSLCLVEKIFPLLSDDTRVHQEWRKLVLSFGVSGVQVHDARIVAAMKVRRLENILTLNPNDFKRYTEIKAVRPQDI